MNRLTTNSHSHPINKAKMEYDKSPAHIGRLVYAVDFICPVGTLVKASLDGSCMSAKLFFN